MRNDDAELMARIVAAARPVRPRPGWRREVWDRLEAPAKRSWGLAVAAAVSFATVMVVSWLPVWAADRAADRTVAASYAERWEVHDDILRVRGQVRAWEEERAAILSELERNEETRRAVVAELVRSDESEARLAPSKPARRRDIVDRAVDRALERAKPGSVMKACDHEDPLCGL